MKDTSSLVSIIIVNWNGLRWLPECFRSLSLQNYKNYEIIFVDNASEDGSVAWVKKHYPKTKIIVNIKNLGFADANNIGYRQAKGEYVLFLNNDTRVTKTFLTELVTVLASDKTIGGAQSKIFLMDDPTRLDSIGAFLTPTGFLFHYNLGGKDRPEFDRQIDLYTAKGAAMMFRRDVLKRAEVDGWLFDPEYFAYFEETDLCHRVWLSGFRIVYAYKAIIHHKMGATSNTLSSSWVQFNSYKNRISSYIKNFGLLNLICILPLHILLCHVLAIIFLLKGNPSWFTAIEKAVWWNIIHLPQTLKQRRFIQTRIRKQPDSEFFPKIMKFPEAGYYTGFLAKFLRVYRP